MKIGVLTYYKTGNFGANLQAVSTYNYLKKSGHEVVFLHYLSRFTDHVETKTAQVNKQLHAHYDFVEREIPAQSAKIFNLSQLKKAIEKYELQAIIIGSDAVLQHFPLFSTLKWGQSLKSWLRPLQEERRFPNIFWGYGFVSAIPTAMISVSSQNSPYKKWCTFTKQRMRMCLNGMKYISVRDEWTRQLVNEVTDNLNPAITPDPVFAFNQNAGHIIPSKEEVCRKFGLSSNYALVGLRGDYLSEETLIDIEKEFNKRGVECVAFPVISPSTLNYAKRIDFPLDPIYWYALIKYSTAYIGNNMHPIVICLHNAVPCFSIDNWGTTNFWGKRIEDGSSKVLDILSRYGLSSNIRGVNSGKCNVSVEEIFTALDHFDKEQTSSISEMQFQRYDEMMKQCLKAIS